MKHSLRKSALAACLCLSACAGIDATAPTAFEWTPAAYLASILSVMERNSINRLRIDWPDFRARVHAAAAGAQTLDETHGAISLALSLLGDGHSSFRSATGEVLRVRTRTCSGAASTSPPLPDGIGYIRVRGFSGMGPAATSFADSLQGAIRSADRSDLAGWIVDLRGNGGGNMWPMLAGIGPILGEGLAGYFIDPLGNRTSWAYRDGAAWNGAFAAVAVTSRFRLMRPDPAVAVLTDNGVASSGEAIAIALRGRPRTRSFGSPTCGLSTANAGFPIGDGSVLNLAVAVMADRSARPYGEAVGPDETVPDEQVVERAVQWLRRLDSH